jgi:hypothetical protein
LVVCQHFGGRTSIFGAKVRSIRKWAIYIYRKETFSGYQTGRLAHEKEKKWPLQEAE